MTYTCIMDVKIRFKLHTEQHDVSVFASPWFLDAVCGKENWDVVYAEKNPDVFGYWPFFQYKKNGFDVLTVPPSVLFLDPVLSIPNSISGYKRDSAIKFLISRLVTKLPKSTKVQFGVSSLNDYPSLFSWNKFQVLARSHYRIERNQQYDEVCEKYQPGLKRQLKKAYTCVKLEEGSVEGFSGVYAKTFEKRGVDAPLTKPQIVTLFNEGRKRRKVSIVLAKSLKNKEIVSGALIIHDLDEDIYFLGGLNHEKGISEAQSAVIDSCIQKALEKGKSFNFYGSSIESIDQFFRQFGGERAINYVLKKQSKLSQVIDLLKA